MTQQSAPVVYSVRIRWEHDASGEPDYLERWARDHFGDDGCNWSHVPEADKAKVVEQYGSIWAACEHYAREDSERLQSFRDESLWFESCRAEAEVRYELYDGSYRIDRLSSGGLFGIESDCGDEHRRSVEQEELFDLSSHLERFGVVGFQVEELLALV